MAQSKQINPVEMSRQFKRQTQAMRQGREGKGRQQARQRAPLPKTPTRGGNEKQPAQGAALGAQLSTAQQQSAAQNLQDQSEVSTTQEQRDARKELRRQQSGARRDLAKKLLQRGAGEVKGQLKKKLKRKAFKVALRYIGLALLAITPILLKLGLIAIIILIILAVPCVLPELADNFFISKILEYTVGQACSIG